MCKLAKVFSVRFSYLSFLIWFLFICTRFFLTSLCFEHPWSTCIYIYILFFFFIALPFFIGFSSDALCYTVHTHPAVGVFYCETRGLLVLYTKRSTTKRRKFRKMEKSFTRISTIKHCEEEEEEEVTRRKKECKSNGLGHIAHIHTQGMSQVVKRNAGMENLYHFQKTPNQHHSTAGIWHKKLCKVRMKERKLKTNKNSRWTNQHKINTHTHLQKSEQRQRARKKLKRRSKIEYTQKQEKWNGQIKWNTLA